MENRNIESTAIYNRHLKPVIEAAIPASGQKISKPMTTDCVIVGRSEDADLTINDLKLSKHHFMLVKNNGKYSIKDLQSTNGIILNGKRVKKALLTGSDKIVAGNTTFRFILTNSDYDKPEPAKMPLGAPIDFTFDKSYRKTERAGSRKTIFVSIIAGLIVTAASLMFFSSEEEVKVAPIAQTQILPASRSIDLEIAETNLNEEDRAKILSYYRLAEYHFNMGNYALAKKSMETVFSLLPDSVIATAFIAACEDQIDRFAKADDNLRELEEEQKRQAVIEDLLKSGYAELDKNNYSGAIAAFQKVLDIDPYNTSAYDGIIIAEKSMQESLPIPPETIEVIRPSKGELLAIQMNNAFASADYTKAYELASRILKMGQRRAGRKYFLHANRTHDQILELTNNMFGPMMAEAGMLEKTGADREAADTYRTVLAQFPYHKQARANLKQIHKKLHEQAKLLYAKALLEETYSNITEAKSKLEMILTTVPKTDSYYRKAKSKLKKLEIAA
ncbi:MAG: FHA domain-containing protein [Oligoflexia bacterium]|nr:FHA domain-containing protein [Oligoflexia bacterium]